MVTTYSNWNVYLQKTKRKNTTDYFKDLENRKKQSESIKKHWENLSLEDKEKIKDRLAKGNAIRWGKEEERSKASEFWKKNNPNYDKLMRINYFLGNNYRVNGDFINSYKNYEECYLLNKKNNIKKNILFYNSI